MTFKKSGRYSVPTDEDFEPNSNQEVLKNFFGITTKEKMEALEERELNRTESELLTLIDEDHQFTAEDICAIHELWLGEIYPFAGKYRSVNMSKDDFTINPQGFEQYILAIHAGMSLNYEPIEKIFKMLFEQSA